MKAFLEQVPVFTNSSFLVREFNVPYFEAPLHIHPVFELTLITSGKGKRFIGDHIDEFDKGDLVFMAPNLPHFYQCSGEYYNNDPAYRAKAIIIQFSEDFLGKDFFSIPELVKVSSLFNDARRGIAYNGRTKKEIKVYMERIRFTEGIDKLMHLLSILKILSETREGELLSKQDIMASNVKDSERMSKIFRFVMENYTKTISLREAAAVANMSEAAFCRFFKKKTRKTFISFINEIRIARASKLLVDDDLNVGQVCYECGFENISNFNRQFKLLTKLSPLTYKNQFTKKPQYTTEYLTI